MDEIFPRNYSVILLGPPGVGKSEYCLDLTKGYINNGEKVIYVTTEKSPSEVRGRLKELGLDLGSIEGKSFLFIDVFTRTAGPKDDKVFHVDNPANLNLVSVRLNEAIDTLGKPARIIFDSMSTFFIHAPEGDVRRFFESINTKVKMDYGFALYTLQEEMHEKKVVIALKSIVDAVLEMKMEESPSLKKKFRVLYAKGITYSQDWVEYHVTNNGFKLGPQGEIPVAKSDAKEKFVTVEKKSPLIKVAGIVVILLLGIIVLGMFKGEKDAPYIATQQLTASPKITVSPAITVAPELTVAPGAVIAAPTTSAPTTTLPPETPPPIVEFRLDGMEDDGNWGQFEGPDAILDFATSTEFTKAGKSMKLTLQILGIEEAYSGFYIRNPELGSQLAGYDGITVWSYVPEPLPLGRLALNLEEEGGSRYDYQRMRRFKQAGWVKDIILFSDLRPDQWGNIDENGQLDLDQVQSLTLSPGGHEVPLGTYVFYLDELNLFKYQETSEETSSYQNILQSDDFDDGSAIWSPGPEWAVEFIGDGTNGVLTNTMESVFTEFGSNWADYSFNFKVKLEQGPVNAYVRIHSTGAYGISFAGNGLVLWKEWEKAETKLAVKEYPFAVNKFYDIKIEAIGNNLNVYVDNNLELSYTDEDNPILVGKVALEVINKAYFDDMQVLGPWE